MSLTLHRVSGEDEELIRRAQQGDKEAFTRLLEQLTPRIFPTIAHLVPDADDAHDALQEIAIQLYKSLPKFQWKSSLYTFVYALMEHVCHSYNKKQRRLPARFTDLESDEDDRSFAERLAGDAHDPASRLEQHERQQAIRLAIAAIPPQFRLVFVLADIEGRSYQEIAELTGANIGTVKSRLNRARACLQKNLLAHPELFGRLQVLTEK